MEALVQDFLRYRRRFRVGITPISSESYPKLTGWPQNLLHETDLYQSIIPFLEGQNADGAVFSLTGERLETALTVSGGHGHDTDLTAIPWWPIGNWQLPANRGDKPTAATLTTDTDFSSALCTLISTVQAGTSRIAIRACVDGPFNAGAASFFSLTFALYGDNDTGFADPITTQLVWDLRASHIYTEAWLETIPIDVSGLDFTADRQLICVVTWAFDVASGAPDMAVYQVLIGALDR